MSKFEILQEIQQLNEIKLSRVLTHFKGDPPVALISAFRSERTLEDNTAANLELANAIRSAGFGYVWVDGAWIENADTKPVHASEVTIMVIGKSGDDDSMLDTLSKMATKYNQDAFIYKASGSDVTKVLDRNLKELTAFKDIHLDKMAEMYTRIRYGSHRGRTFVFEGVRLSPGFAGRLAGLKD